MRVVLPAQGKAPARASTSAAAEAAAAARAAQPEPTGAQDAGAVAEELPAGVDIEIKIQNG